MVYKKCPRCNLNYIKDSDLLCKICLEEVGKAIRNNDEEEEYDICPECGENIIKSGEDMCYQCMMEQVKDEIDEVERKEGEWEDFLPKVEEEEIFEEEEEEELGGLEEISLDLVDEDEDADEDVDEDEYNEDDK